jgi:sulfate/thiosulfate transport system permease protein
VTTVSARRHVLPGLSLTLGFAVLYVSLLVLVPLAALVAKASTLTWSQFWATVASERVVASYRLTFGMALAAAAVNTVFGCCVAWVLVRYRFPGRRLVDALVDLPLALPTAVSGIALTTIYSSQGWMGRYLELVGITVAYSPLGVAVALAFVGLPFVVRTVQPALADLDVALEEASTTLGASRAQTVGRVIIPTVLPAVATGFTLALARGVGEYGSVIFISGNLPMRTEITSLLVMARLEQFDYAGATAIAVVMLLASFSVLLVINTLQWWGMRRHREAV